MALRKITFTNSTVTAQDDADLYYFLLNDVGVLKGIKNELKYSIASNKVTFKSGYVNIYGRQLLIEEDTQIIIPLNKVAFGYVIVEVNSFNNTAELTYIEGSSYPVLKQEDLSKGNGVYQFPLIKYSKTSINLTEDTSFILKYLIPDRDKLDSIIKEYDKKFEDVETELSNKLEESIYNTDKAELQKAINSKVNQEDYNSDMNEIHNLIDNKSKIEKSNTNGNIKLNDEEVKVYNDTELREKIEDISESDYQAIGRDKIFQIPEDINGEYLTLNSLGGKSSVINKKISVNLGNVGWNHNGNGIFYSNELSVFSTRNYPITLSNNTLTFYGNYNGAWAISAFPNNMIIVNNGNRFLVRYDGQNDGSVINTLLNGIIATYETNETEFKFEYPQTIKSVGSNWFNENTMLEIGGIGDSGVNWNTTSRKRSLYIDVVPNCDYYLSVNNLSNYNIYFYDINKNYISTTNGGYFKTPTNCYYIRFYGGLDMSNIILSVGTTKIDYVPYQQPIQLTLENVLSYVASKLVSDYGWSTEMASKWLGYAINDNNRNLLHIANDKALVPIAPIDLSNLNWNYIADEEIYYCDVDVKNQGSSLASNYVSTTKDYSTLQIGELTTFWSTFSSKAKIIIKSTSTPSGILLYELATPIEIDLTNLQESVERHLRVWKGGSIIFLGKDNNPSETNYNFSIPLSIQGHLNLNTQHDIDQQRAIEDLEKKTEDEIGYLESSVDIARNQIQDIMSILRNLKQYAHNITIELTNSEFIAFTLYSSLSNKFNATSMCEKNNQVIVAGVFEGGESATVRIERDGINIFGTTNDNYWQTNDFDYFEDDVVVL